SRDVLSGVYEDDRLARLGIALEVVERRQVLQLLLQYIGDLVGDFGRCGTGVPGAHQHHSKCEVGIFALMNHSQRKQASQEEHSHREADKWPMAKRPIGEIEGHWLCPGVCSAAIGTMASFRAGSRLASDTSVLPTAEGAKATAIWPSRSLEA